MNEWRTLGKDVVLTIGGSGHLIPDPPPLEPGDEEAKEGAKADQRQGPPDENQEPREYLVPKGKHLAVQEGDFIAKGEYILDGKRNSLRMDPQASTVLAAAQGAGLDLPFSCAGGMCCTCRCKILEGDATMDVNYSLQDWEIEAGFTLACQSRPTSDHLVLDFDAT